MKLKLTNDELLAIRDIVQITVDEFRHHFTILSMEQKLSLSLLEEMLYKVSCKALEKKPEYGLTLKPSWAIAFQIAFSGNVKLITYEGRTIQKICDQIHQSYS